MKAHGLFMAIGYPKVIKDTDLLRFQSSASSPDKGGRNDMSSPYIYLVAGL